MSVIAAFLVAVVSGVMFFVAQKGVELIVALSVLTIITRIYRRSREVGKFVEILLIFCLISILIDSLGIHYPYSLIIILAALVVLIFYEGPEWSKLFFAVGSTKRHFVHSLWISAVWAIVFGVWIYVRAAAIKSPLPENWPIDALIVAGIGFAFYKAIVEEVIFRSFIYQRASSAAGEAIGVPVQAAFYGLMQYRVGIPGGLEGVILGTLFGACLGYIVYKTKSLYLAILVQLIVTLTVFVELAILG